VAIAALVRVARARRQRRRLQHLGVGRDAVPELVRQGQRVQFQDAHVIRRLAGMQAALVRDEADGDVSADRLARALPGIGIEARGHVQREDRLATGVQAPQQVGYGGLRRAGQAGAIQRIHVHIGHRQPGHGAPWLDLAAGFLEAAARRRGVAARFAGKREQHHLIAGLQGERAEQEAVAAVVAGSAVHRDASRARPVALQRGESSRRGAAHEFDAGDTQRVDGATVQRTHLVDGIELVAVRAWRHARDYRREPYPADLQ